MALNVSSIQTGQVTIDTTSKSVTVTAVSDITDCLLFFTVSADESFPQPQHSAIRGQLTDTTTIDFVVADADSSSRVVEWQLIEFEAGVVDVQRGTVGGPLTASNDVTITSVGDLDNAWEIFNGHDLSGTGYTNGHFFQLYLSSVTNLRVEAHGVGANSIDWQVCKFEDGSEVSVQRGVIATDTAATTEFTDTISAVTLANSFVVLNGWRINGGPNPNIGTYLAKFNSTTEIAVQKDTADTTDAEVRYLVVELPNVDVQTGLMQFIATDGQETATITAVSDNRLVFSSSFTPWGQGVGKAGYSANDLYGEAMARLKFNTSTQIQADRSETNDTLDLQWVVLDFGTGGGGAAAGRFTFPLLGVG